MAKPARVRRAPYRTGRGRAKGTARRRAAGGARSSGRIVLLVGTRKGAFIFTSDAALKAWKMDGPHFLGQEVNHLVLDPRDRRTLLMAAKTGHLGPTVFRSTDWGKTWAEAKQPPAHQVFCG